MVARFSKVELTRAIKVVQKCGLKVSQISFDENGYPVIKCVDDAEMRKQVIDDLRNKPSHEISSWDEWDAKKKCESC